MFDNESLLSRITHRTKQVVLGHNDISLRGFGEIFSIHYQLEAMIGIKISLSLVAHIQVRHLWQVNSIILFALQEEMVQ